MKARHVSLVVAFCLLSFSAPVDAQEQTQKPAGNPFQTLSTSPTLQAIVDEARDAATKKFAGQGLKEHQLAITLIDLREPERPAQASFRGEEPAYPASVVKLFYLVAAHQWFEDGRLEEADELQRALRDMIAVSSNDATGYVLDVLTDTTSGKELPPEEMAQWQDNRNAVNRYFTSLGYININANQKTFCEDAYGRERFSRGPKGENRNKLTTNATARLMAEIATGRAITPARSQKMLELLKRNLSTKSTNSDDQSSGFTGIALKGVEGARLWSKAGWTSTTRHDAAYIELPGGAKFVLVTFTTDQAKNRDLIPTVARVVIDRMSRAK